MTLFAFDGTWNRRDPKSEDFDGTPATLVDQEPLSDKPFTRYNEPGDHFRDTTETNVYRFTEFYGGSHAALYQQGVGTRHGKLGAAAGGAAGLGARHRINRAYEVLCKRWFHDNDRRIDVIGFSRGAAMAIHFCNLVAEYGVQEPKVPLSRRVSNGFTRFRHAPPSTPNDKQNAKISFLGLWDTVASFGIPIHPFRNTRSTLSFQQLPSNVSTCAHAMALDEYRRAFELVRPRKSPGSETSLYEVWFRGVHSNVGGGYRDRGLSDIALAWMMEMALVEWGLEEDDFPTRFKPALTMLDPSRPPRPDWMTGTIEALDPNPNGVIERPILLPVLPRKGGERDIVGTVRKGGKVGPPLVHHAVSLRNTNLVSDHLNSNRELTRWIPADTSFVPDPPLLLPPSRGVAGANACAAAL